MNCHYDKIVITKVKKWKYVFRYRYPAYYSLLKLFILDSQMKTLKLLQKSMNLNTQKSLYLAAILAGDKLLPLGMLGEHVIVKTTLAEKVFAT